MAKKKATAVKKAVKKTSVKAAPVKKKPSAAKPAAKRSVKPAAPAKKAAKGKKPAPKPAAKKVVKSAAPAKAVKAASKTTVKKVPAKLTGPAKAGKAAPKKAVKAPAKAPAKPVPVAKSASPAKAGKPAPAPKPAAAPPKAAPAPVVAKPAPAAKAPAPKSAPTPVAAPSKPVPAAKAANGVKTKAPVVAVLTGLDPLGAPVRTLKRAMKERFQKEYYLRATPGSLYDLISTPSGFSEWFCDDVNVRGDEYGFVWNGEVEIAECLSTRAGELIRFHWQDDDDAGSFFELRIRIDPMTNETCLVVTDHAWPKDLEEAKALWDSQIQTLQRVLGA